MNRQHTSQILTQQASGPLSNTGLANTQSTRRKTKVWRDVQNIVFLSTLCSSAPGVDMLSPCAPRHHQYCGIQTLKRDCSYRRSHEELQLFVFAVMSSNVSPPRSATQCPPTVPQQTWFQILQHPPSVSTVSVAANGSDANGALCMHEIDAKWDR